MVLFGYKIAFWKNRSNYEYHDISKIHGASGWMKVFHLNKYKTLNQSFQILIFNKKLAILKTNVNNFSNTEFTKLQRSRPEFLRHICTPSSETSSILLKRGFKFTRSTFWLWFMKLSTRILMMKTTAQKGQ